MADRAAGGESTPFRTSTLIVHVLLSLADGPAHAYGIMKEIARRTRGRLTPGPGSIHFTLHKLLGGEMIAESPPPAPDGDDARRRYYRLTGHGRAVLAAEIDALEEIVAVARSKNLVVERRR